MYFVSLARCFLTSAQHPAPCYLNCCAGRQIYGEVQAALLDGHFRSRVFYVNQWPSYSCVLGVSIHSPELHVVRQPPTYL